MVRLALRGKMDGAGLWNNTHLELSGQEVKELLQAAGEVWDHPAEHVSEHVSHASQEGGHSAHDTHYVLPVALFVLSRLTLAGRHFSCPTRLVTSPCSTPSVSVCLSFTPTHR